MNAFRALALAGTLVVLSGAAMADEVVRVVTSIKPVHSLVAAVMQGAGVPHLIVKGGGSPHTYSLKPSDAKALESARVVFWIGHDMEAFLEKSIETLADRAKVVSLEDAHGLIRLKFREGGPFEAHDDHEEGSHEADKDHGDDDHKKHAKDGHGDEEHAHDETDMHLWLDPENAAAMVREIEKTLIKADPVNAATYKANAQALGTKLDVLSGEISAMVAPVKDRPFIVFHDAYQYFEKRFGVTAAGSITVSPEALPGAKRISEIQAKAKELNAACVFAEPQFEPKLVTVIADGAKVRSAILDPLGAGLKDGPELYFQLMRDMARSMKACLSESG